MNCSHSLPRATARVALALLGVAIVLIVTGTGASAPPGRYTIPGNGTVFDTKTGLTWQQGTPATTMTQTAAISYCAGMNLAGSGWRLPTAFELQTLVDYSQPPSITVAMIDPTAFPSTPANGFWSATLLAGESGQLGWYVEFVNGTISHSQLIGMFNVRCVH